jgi:hypothetical protein
MKKVFNNSKDVIHLFAQRTQDEARCSNVFFRGDRIYSYGHHYVLGDFLDEKTILINDTGYSNTTNKHIFQLTLATRQYKQFFVNQCQLKQVYEQVVKHVDSLGNARKPEKYVSEILSLWDSMNEFIEYRKLKQIKKSTEYKWIKNVVKRIESDKDNYLDDVKKHKKKELEKDKKQYIKDKNQFLQSWYNHEKNYFYTQSKFHKKSDFVRVSEDNKLVETSQGVKIDINEAINLYRLIDMGVDIKGMKIGYYKITSLKDSLVIGCHDIDLESMHKVGKQLLKIA